MIASDYETRLVDRIAAREVIAATNLTAQQRRVLCDWGRSDATLEEIGGREGVSKQRIRQIVAGSVSRLEARAKPPPDFDKAAFLRHMQGLIVQRAAKEREALEWERNDAFARERRSLDAIMRSEEAQGLFDPPAPAKFKPPPYVPPPYVPPRPFQPLIYDVPHVPSASPQQTVEPWFDLARTPTPSDLSCIAHYALGYLGAIRHQPGSGVMGTKAAHVIIARDADAIAAALQSLSRAIPATARLSTCLLDVPKDLLGASLATAVGAMRVVSMAEGQQVSIEVTYD